MTDMRSGNRTNWQTDQKAVKQPGNIDYSQLLGKLSGIESQKPAKNSGPKDFRKVESTTKPITHFMYEDPSHIYKNEEDGVLNNIDKSSIIPVPGMMISTENDEHDWKPPTSDWVAPQGPQWGPMTQN